MWTETIWLLKWLLRIMTNRHENAWIDSFRISIGYVWILVINFAYSPSQVYEGELARLRRENTSLKDQLQRSLQELKAYHVKYPASVPISTFDGDENIPPWSIAPEILTPLFEAYDSRKFIDSSCIIQFNRESQVLITHLKKGSVNSSSLFRSNYSKSIYSARKWVVILVALLEQEFHDFVSVCIYLGWNCSRWKRWTSTKSSWTPSSGYHGA